MQVLITDSLPHYVCFDCCLLLNQSNDFFERTNQAQESLRNLLIVPKVEYVEKSVEYPKEDAKENVGDCELSDNYNKETTDDMGEEYFNDDNNDSEVETKEEILTEQEIEMEKEKKSKAGAKKTTPLTTTTTKQTKKKVKRRSSQMTKISSSDIGGTNSDMEDQNETGNDFSHSKAGTKIPDNYMTGTVSDVEMIEARAAEPPKPGRNRGEGLDRYPWLCTDCNDKLPSLEMLEQHHVTVHNQQAKYMCVQCSKVYDKYFGFLTHVKRHKTKTKFR